jgi:subtilisin family serine protease
MKVTKLKTILMLVGVSTLVGCRPAQKDPYFNYNHNREDAKVSDLQLLPENPLNTIGAVKLWEKTTGISKDGSRVVVGVVGTGIDYNIPDLRDALWTNTGELGDTKSQNALDDDGNGFADDYMGYDFSSGDALPFDWHGHDTVTSTIIASTARTNTGLVGVAPNAALMIARYIGSDGRAKGFDAVAALEYVIKNGASVVYFNWPQGGFKPAETNLILATFKEAQAKNVLIVMPAGNGRNQDVPALVTGASQIENVIVVSGLDMNGKLSRTTNYGKGIADLAAPSEGSVGYLPGGKTTSQIKTSSIAAAYVTGAAALISTLPQYGSAQKIKAALMSGASIDKSREPIDVLAQGSLSLENF